MTVWSNIWEDIWEDIWADSPIAPTVIDLNLTPNFITFVAGLNK